MYYKFLNMDISIIVPHKNSTALLERLLLSIPDTKKTEIIIVDDQSEKEEKEKLKSFISKYKIKFYENEGRYAGGARNTGLKYATGKWIMFADADDYFTIDVRCLIEQYLNSDYDIVFFNVISKYSATGEDAYRAAHVQSLIQKASSKNDLDVLRCCYTAPWGKMIKRQLVQENDIRFDEVIAGNDMMFSVLCGIKAKSIGYEKNPIYCVTVTWGSITTTLTRDRFDSRFKVTLNVNNLLRKEGYGKYQISVLYFIAKSYQFGIKYMLSVIIECIKNRSNIFVGFAKLLNVKSVLKDRQNIKKSEKEQK